MLFKIGVKLLKSLSKYLLLFSLFTAVLCSLVILSSGGSSIQTDDQLIVNDITQLNPITVAEIVRPKSIDSIALAITSSEGAISIGGGRFSQGGQTAFPDSLHLDMRGFNQVLELNVEQQWVRVQSGITWRDLQQIIDPHDLSIKIMQTYANFTVGGSVSVNVHGRYIGEGPLVRSVISLKLVLANGDIVMASPTQNATLFYGVIGGYGGLAVIAEVTLQLVPNIKVARTTSTMTLADYAEHFKDNVRDNPDMVFHNADIYPPDFEQIRNVSWHKTDQALTENQRLNPKEKVYGWQPKAADFVAQYDIGKWARQHIIDPYIYADDAVYWRNFEASYDVNELEPDDRLTTTYALREYFVPVENFDSFAAKMKEIFTRNQANIVNVSVRHALPDPGTLLAWADSEVFAFVVYYRQGTSLSAQLQVKRWSAEMIDAVISERGSYYLPYQLHASTAQFKRAYPRADQYFALKDLIDPNNRFRNKLWQIHYPKNQAEFSVEKDSIAQYYRNEGQTLLTIPEWYLVFNPLEYANFLDAGNNPSDFPFFASIDQYWQLYDNVTELAGHKYANNDEYMTMLQVIGISTTIEYMYKGAYENTLGRFTRWTADNPTPEDDIIAAAHRAYSKLIFDQAWYEFDFGIWVTKIWSEPDFFGHNFIRKLERKLIFSLEFGFKKVYAAAIEYAAKSSYQASDGKIYLTAHSNYALTPQQLAPAEIIASTGNKLLLSAPRWGGFSTLIPKISRLGISFEDISGNQLIAISYLTNTDKPFMPSIGDHLFDSKMVSLTSVKRVVYQVKVTDLANFINEVNRNGHDIEHIYDY